MDGKKRTVCNIRIDEDIYRNDRIICKNGYNINRKNYIINTFSREDNNKGKCKVVNSVNNTKLSKMKTKVVDSVNNRTLLIRCQNCVKTYLVSHILHQKQEPIFLSTKSLNQYPNIKAQTSDEV